LSKPSKLRASNGHNTARRSQQITWSLMKPFSPFVHFKLISGEEAGDVTAPVASGGDEDVAVPTAK
jgi:hypothetical protein